MAMAGLLAPAPAPGAELAPRWQKRNELLTWQLSSGRPKAFM
jgi:hypothetical protein